MRVLMVALPRVTTIALMLLIVLAFALPFHSSDAQRRQEICCLNEPLLRQVAMRRWR